MIVNVINGQSAMAESTSNIFSGMSLAEACGQLQANVSDILNEMNMGILLNEHLYLRENGTDIQYVNEADTKLKDRIGSAIDDIIKQVSQLWDRLVKWVQDRVEDVRMAFARASLPKKKVQELISDYTPFTNDTVAEKADVKVVNHGKLVDLTKKIKIEALASINDDTFKVDSYLDRYKSIDKEIVNDAYDIVYNTDRKLLASIRESKKAAMTTLNNCKKTIRAGNAENKADALKNVNENSRKVSKLSSFAIKLYHMEIDLAIKVLKAALKPSKAAKDADRIANKEKKQAEKDAKKSTDWGDGDDGMSESAIFSNNRFFSV